MWHWDGYNRVNVALVRLRAAAAAAAAGRAGTRAAQVPDEAAEADRLTMSPRRGQGQYR